MEIFPSSAILTSGGWGGNGGGCWTCGPGPGAGDGSCWARAGAVRKKSRQTQKKPLEKRFTYASSSSNFTGAEPRADPWLPGGPKRACSQNVRCPSIVPQSQGHFLSEIVESI